MPPAPTTQNDETSPAKAMEPVTKACGEVYDVMSAEQGGIINKEKLVAMEGSAFFEKIAADVEGNVSREPWDEFFQQLMTNDGKDAIWIITFLRRLITRALLNWKSEQQEENVQVTLQLGEQIREMENRLYELLKPTKEQAALRLRADEAEIGLLQTLAVENELKNVQLLKTKLSVEEMEHARQVQIHTYVELHTHDVERSVKSMWQALFRINEALPFLRQVRAEHPYAQDDSGAADQHVQVDVCMRKAVEHLHRMEGFLDQLGGRISTHLTEVTNENKLIRAVLDDAKTSGDIDPMVGFLCTNYEGQLDAIKQAHENEIKMLHDSISAQVEKLHELHCSEMSASREENSRSKTTISKLKMELEQLEKSTLAEIEELREKLVEERTSEHDVHAHQRVPIVKLEAALADFEKERQKNLMLVRENANIKIEMHHIKAAHKSGVLSLSENIPPNWPWLPSEEAQKLPGVTYPDQSQAPARPDGDTCMGVPIESRSPVKAVWDKLPANTTSIRPEAWKGAAKVARLLAGLGAEATAAMPLRTPLLPTELNAAASSCDLDAGSNTVMETLPAAARATAPTGYLGVATAQSHKLPAWPHGTDLD